MENLAFAVLALLPLALLGFRRSWSASDANIFGLALGGIAKLLAPVVASGVSKLIGHKQAKSKAKQEEEILKQKALADEASAKARFEAEQASPQNLARRQTFTMQLGKLLGKAGGKEKIPPSIYNYLQTQRTTPSYVAGPGYQAPPKKGGGIWDVLGGAGEALSYLDTTKLGRKPRPAGPSGLEGATFQTGQLNKVIPKAGLAVQTITRQPWENVLSPGQPVRPRGL